MKMVAQGYCHFSYQGSSVSSLNIYIYFPLNWKEFPCRIRAASNGGVDMGISVL